jgi:hypothetical protein
MFGIGRRPHDLEDRATMRAGQKTRPQSTRSRSPSFPARTKGIEYCMITCIAIFLDTTDLFGHLQGMIRDRPLYLELVEGPTAWKTVLRWDA